MQSKKFLFLFVSWFFATQIATAQQWQFVGTRAMGMGGAGVATAYGPDAQYWNPAGLAQHEDLNEAGLLINAGAQMEATKHILEGVRNLTEISGQYKALQKTLKNGKKASASDVETMFQGLNDIAKIIGKEMGALVNANAGVGFKTKNFAVGIRALGTGSITPVVDTKNLKFYSSSGSNPFLGEPDAILNPAQTTAAQMLANAIDANGIFGSLKTLLHATSCNNSLELATALVDAVQSYGTYDEDLLKAFDIATHYIAGASEIINLAGQATGNYKDNKTLVMVDAATFAEAGLGYGQQLIPGLNLGGNFKVISGYTAQSGVMVMTKDDKIADIFDKAYDNKKRSTNIGIDIGAMVNLSQLLDKEILLNPQFGLTARNLNSPRFARPDVPANTANAIARNWRTKKYELQPQLRIGAAINPIKKMTVAADIDVTENDTLLDHIKSRQLALGLEMNVVNRPKFNIPLRFGFNKNLATGNMSPFYTAGIGLNMIHFHIELAGAISRKSTKIEGHDIPNSAAASLTMGFLF